MFPSGMKVFLNRARNPISCCLVTWEGGAGCGGGLSVCVGGSCLQKCMNPLHEKHFHLVILISSVTTCKMFL